MILLLANSYIQEHFNNNNNKSKEYEYENENENENEYEYENENENKYLIWIMLYYIICFVAAYLSWDINTKIGYPLDVKLACALNAYSFGIFYIMYYMYIMYSDKKY
jgi:uncharacterized membrane protein YhdT